MIISKKNYQKHISQLEENVKDENNYDLLTLYYFPSPKGLSWASPGSIAMTSLINQLSFQDRKIGHVTVEYIRKRKGKYIEYFHTGMIGQKMGKVTKVLLQKMGFGVIFYNFPGSLEKAEDLQQEIVKKFSNGRVSFASFEILKKTGERIKQYYDEYREFGGSNHYGLPNRPRYKEGGGCSAFATSFLEVAGVLNDDHTKNWSYEINVPLEFTGKPVTNKKIGIRKLLFSGENKQWSSEENLHKKIFFWDPDQMHRWLLKKYSQYKDNDSYQLMMRDKAKGLYFNCLKVKTPKESIWLTDKK